MEILPSPPVAVCVLFARRNFDDVSNSHVCETAFFTPSNKSQSSSTVSHVQYTDHRYSVYRCSWAATQSVYALYPCIVHVVGDDNTIKHVQKLKFDHKRCWLWSCTRTNNRMLKLYFGLSSLQRVVSRATTCSPGAFCWTSLRCSLRSKCWP